MKFIFATYSIHTGRKCNTTFSFARKKFPPPPLAGKTFAPQNLAATVTYYVGQPAKQDTAFQKFTLYYVKYIHLARKGQQYNCASALYTGKRGREGLSHLLSLPSGQEPLESPSLPLLPVLASYIAELKPTSSEAPGGLYKAETSNCIAALC